MTYKRNDYRIRRMLEKRILMFSDALRLSRAPEGRNHPLSYSLSTTHITTITITMFDNSYKYLGLLHLLP